jgi:hypothetical protein
MGMGMGSGIGKEELLWESPHFLSLQLLRERRTTKR